MMIYPSIDLLNGRGVQLVQGDLKRKKLEFDPIETAKKWTGEGAKYIHIIDLDSVFGQGSNIDTIKRICGIMNGKVQVGGGVRTEEKIRELFDIGAERVITGTRGVQDREWLKRMVRKYSGKIIQSVDSIGTEMVVKGWTENTGLDAIEYAKSIESSDLAGFLYTNVQVEGLCEGIDPQPVKKLTAALKLPVIVSGGITTLDDLKVLKESGAKGAVIGMALYIGKIKLKDALKV